MVAYIRWSCGLTAIALGAGYFFGPASFYSSDIFFYVKATGIPVPIWGLVFIIAGLIIIVHKGLVGYALAMVSILIWTTCLWLTVTNGKAVSWGSLIFPLFYVSIIGYIVREKGKRITKLTRDEKIDSFRQVGQRVRETPEEGR